MKECNGSSLAGVESWRTTPLAETLIPHGLWDGRRVTAARYVSVRPAGSNLSGLVRLDLRSDNRFNVVIFRALTLGSPRR